MVLERTAYYPSITDFLATVPAPAAWQRLFLTESGQTVRFVPGYLFEYPGRNDGTDGRWVDERWILKSGQCIDGVAVNTGYKSDELVANSPNSDHLWSAVTVGTGTVTQVADYTRFHCPAPGDDAYIQVGGGIASQLASTYIIFEDLEVIASDGREPRSEYNNLLPQGGAGVSPVMFFGNPGISGIAFQFGGPGYNNGSRFGVTFDFFDAPTCVARDYDTGMVIAVTQAAQEGGTVTHRLRVGIRGAGANVELRMRGNPGVTLLSRA